MCRAFTSILLALCMLQAGSALSTAADSPPKTGPETEKRFPPLKVPAGFKATLFACDPLVEYPSVISAGPRPGAIYVAYDYMTGLGTEIIRRDEVRLVEDTDGDGYADKSTLYAGGFNSIMGLAYHDGTVYVMHAPYLTALRDTKGTGSADERKDLLTGLGLEPEKNPVRLHCANGVTVGHDGWLYLAMGDNGTNVLRPEGDRLVLNGGGILRCRPDGRDLHVFSSGLRNIYDVSLDAELNVFVRDNENDGGTYKIRVCHSFHGADHGYPYLYEERPDEAMKPLADLGLGSSAGGVCYLERQFPAEYRGGLFNCEWGKSLVFYPLVREECGFARRDEMEFAAGAANDPYGFKPTDVVVQRDGTLMISDWCDGQRPMRGRGAYHVAYVGDGAKTPAVKPVPKDAGLDHWIGQLDSESYAERCDAQLHIEKRGEEGLKAITVAMADKRLEPRGRLHAVWVHAHLKGAAAIEDLLRIAKTDSDLSVRAQSVRAIADLADPMFVTHKLDAGPGDETLAVRLTAVCRELEPQLVLEVVVGIGRLRWKGTPDWLKEYVVFSQHTQSHAAQQALRRCGNWPAVLTLLDLSSAHSNRAFALRAIAEQFALPVVDDLLQRVAAEKDATRRLEYADLLARVHHKPGPWVYWGYRPGPRPANTVAWERTEAIAAALNRTLADPDLAVRLAVLKRMQREKVPVAPESLLRWLKDERDAERIAVLLASLRDAPAADFASTLLELVRDVRHSPANRLAALGLMVREDKKIVGDKLLALVVSLEDGPVLADAIRRLREHPKAVSSELLVKKLQSESPAVRAAAIEAVGELRANVEPALLATLLADKDPLVRRAAAMATGKLAAKEAAMAAIEALWALPKDPDAAVRRASLNSLRLLGQRDALPLAVAALEDRETSTAALEFLRELGGPEQATSVANLAKRNPSTETTAAVARVLSAWGDRERIKATQRQAVDSAMAEIHGESGILVRWDTTGPLAGPDVPAIVAAVVSSGFSDRQWLFANGTEARVSLAPKDSAQDSICLAGTHLWVPEPTDVEFLASSSGSLEVWLNGKSLYRREKTRNFQIDSDRFAGTLAKGENRVLVSVGPTPAAVEFHLRFRRKSASAEHERLTLAALTRSGNAERGKLVALNLEKSQCLKCHRLNDQGERFGPELTGVGSRFSRIYLAESILNPSRTIAPSFNTISAILKDGLVVSGVKVAENETTLTLADKEGKKHTLAKAEIEEQKSSPISTMPEGLEKKLTEEEFVDLVAYFASLKESRAP